MNAAAPQHTLKREQRTLPHLDQLDRALALNCAFRAVKLVLWLLRHPGCYTQAALAAAMECNQANLCGVLAALEEEGLIMCEKEAPTGKAGPRLKLYRLPV